MVAVVVEHRHRRRRQRRRHRGRRPAPAGAHAGIRSRPWAAPRCRSNGANNPNVSGYSVQQVAPESVATAPRSWWPSRRSTRPGPLHLVGADPSHPYCLPAVALNDIGASPASATECADTPGEAPFPPPTGLTATPVEGSAAVALAWSAADPDRPATSCWWTTRPTWRWSGHRPSSPSRRARTASACWAAPPTAATPRPRTRCACPSPPPVDRPRPPPPRPRPVPPPCRARPPRPRPGHHRGRLADHRGPHAPPVATTVAPTPTTAAAPVLVEPGWMAQLEAFPADDYAATEPLERAQTRRKAAGGRRGGGGPGPQRVAPAARACARGSSTWTASRPRTRPPRWPRRSARTSWRGACWVAGELPHRERGAPATKP